MSLIDFLSQKIFNPIQQKREAPEVPGMIRELMKSQFYSAEQIHELQLAKIKKLVEYAYETNEFYKSRWDDIGAKPQDIETFDDFHKLPLLTKDDLRQHLEQLFSKGYTRENTHRRRTGGSTGVPVQVFWNTESKNLKLAVAYRHDSWAGDLPGTKKAGLWGDTSKKPSLKGRLYRALITRTIAMDTLLMDDDYVLGFLDRARDFKPDILFGHGHSLYYFAKFIQDHDIKDIRFKGIISSAEALPPEERKVVEEVFGRIVFDRYGCEEVSLIASECETHEGMHIAAESNYAEIIDGTETVPGRLVITDLSNYATPIIRYEIGDLATTMTGQCSCGRGLPRLGRVVGRTTDILYTPEGRKISGVSILDTFTIHIPGFKQVQIVQEKINEVILYIVKDEHFNETSLKQLAEQVPKIFGPNMKYQVSFVDKMAMTSRGKFQFTICNLSKEDIPSP